jgi:hypothetical protein
MLTMFAWFLSVMSWAYMNALIVSNTWSASIKLGTGLDLALSLSPAQSPCPSSTHHTTHFFQTSYITYSELLVNRHIGIKVYASSACSQLKPVVSHHIIFTTSTDLRHVWPFLILLHKTTLHKTVLDCGLDHLLPCQNNRVNGAYNVLLQLDPFPCVHQT